MDDAAAERADLVSGTVDVMADRLAGFQELGLHHLVCGLEPRTASSIRDFGNVIAGFDTIRQSP
jgi:hypothetical protein